jgi:hypothetical protein
MRSIRQDILEHTGVEVPISGGMGQSEDDPIVIDDTDASRSAHWEHQVVGFIARMRGVGYTFERSELFTKGNRTLERFKVSWEGDEDNYHNFYFDVTSALKH